jgi:hypothetical protein
MKNKFTRKQINNFKSYERVRASGAYNMYDPQARQAAGLTLEEYTTVMMNYSALKEVTGDFNADEYLLKQTDHS